MRFGAGAGSGVDSSSRITFAAVASMRSSCSSFSASPRENVPRRPDANPPMAAARISPARPSQMVQEIGSDFTTVRISTLGGAGAGWTGTGAVLIACCTVRSDCSRRCNCWSMLSCFRCNSLTPESSARAFSSSPGVTTVTAVASAPQSCISCLHSCGPGLSPSSSARRSVIGVPGLAGVKSVAESPAGVAVGRRERRVAFVWAADFAGAAESAFADLRSSRRSGNHSTVPAATSRLRPSGNIFGLPASTWCTRCCCVPRWAGKSTAAMLSTVSPGSKLRRKPGRCTDCALSAWAGVLGSAGAISAEKWRA